MVMLENISLSTNGTISVKEQYLKQFISCKQKSSCSFRNDVTVTYSLTNHKRVCVCVCVHARACTSLSKQDLVLTHEADMP